MIAKALIASLAVAVGTAGASLPAAAQVSLPPVALVAWHVDEPIGGAEATSANPADGSRTLQVAFVNRGQLAETDVEFVVRAGRAEETVDARGTFAPGLEITQNLQPNIIAPTSIEVEAVTFSDGTTWHA